MHVYIIISYSIDRHAHEFPCVHFVSSFFSFFCAGFVFYRENHVTLCTRKYVYALCVMTILYFAWIL